MSSVGPFLTYLIDNRPGILLASGTRVK